MIDFEINPARKISLDKYLSQSSRNFIPRAGLSTISGPDALPLREVHAGLAPFAETTLFGTEPSGKAHAMAPLLLIYLRRPQIIIKGVRDNPPFVPKEYDWL
jgi:hypothetical protein